MNADEVLEKLLAAGNWPAAAAGILTAAWIMFRGKNDHPEWAEKSDLDDLKDEVKRMDGKVDGLDTKVDKLGETVHNAREALARIEGLLEGQKR